METAFHAGTHSVGLEKAVEFKTTHWSVILAAGETTSPRAAAALEQLCRKYWYPLYAYVRRNGHRPEDAQDLVQEFFFRFLRQRSVRRADRNRGRFRTFLLTSLKHFLINEWSKANREKRGGGRQFVYLDAADSETRFLAEPADDRTPDKAFERHWAMVVLDRVMAEMRAEFAAGERAWLFDELKPFLTGDDGELSYEEISTRVGMTHGNLKVTVHRLRRRYREVLRKEIAQTVEHPGMVENEIRELVAALRA